MTFSRVLYYGTNSCWWRKKAEFIIPSIMQGTKIPTVLSPWWRVFDAGIVEMLISVMQFSYFYHTLSRSSGVFLKMFLPWKLYVYTIFQVSMDAEGKNEWTECFTVTGVRLPLGYYFGVSAATGQLAGEYRTENLLVSVVDLEIFKPSKFSQPTLFSLLVFCFSVILMCQQWIHSIL